MLWSNEINKVEVEYTGGNVWIAYLYTDEHTYYVANTADYEFDKLDDRGEDENEGMCMNVIAEHWYDESTDDLTDEEKKILDRLLKALDEKEKEYYL